MISTILSVEKYDLVNTVTIIANRFNVSMFVSMSVFLRLSVKKKKRNSVFDFVKFSISKSYNAVFFRLFRLFFDALSVSSTLLSVAFASTRFFVSLSSDYRDSLSVFWFRFFSKISQEEFHISFHFSINLKKKKMWNIFRISERLKLDSESCWNLFNSHMNQTKILCLFVSQCRIAIENDCVFSASSTIRSVEKIIEKSANAAKTRTRCANRYVFEFASIFFR